MPVIDRNLGSLHMMLTFPATVSVAWETGTMLSEVATVVMLGGVDVSWCSDTG